MKVGLLRTEQKETIQGKEFAPDSYFNPILDKNNKWVISLQEIEQCNVTEFSFVKNLPLIDFEPKIVELK